MGLLTPTVVKTSWSLLTSLIRPGSEMPPGVASEGASMAMLEMRSSGVGSRGGPGKRCLCCEDEIYVEGERQTGAACLPEGGLFLSRSGWSPVGESAAGGGRWETDGGGRPSGGTVGQWDGGAWPAYVADPGPCTRCLARFT